MKQWYASVLIDLPADEDEAATVRLIARPLWDVFLNGLADAKIDCVVKRDTLESRAKPATTGAKRGRKLRQPPALVSPPDEPA